MIIITVVHTETYKTWFTIVTFNASKPLRFHSFSTIIHSHKFPFWIVWFARHDLLLFSVWPIISWRCLLAYRIASKVGILFRAKSTFTPARSLICKTPSHLMQKYYNNVFGRRPVPPSIWYLGQHQSAAQILRSQKDNEKLFGEERTTTSWCTWPDCSRYVHDKTPKVYISYPIPERVILSNCCLA